MSVEYRTIKEFPDYLVYEDGKVFSCKSQKFLKPGINSQGYHVVNLCVDGTVYSRRVHRLVAYAFLINPYNKLFVDHIDRNPSNNHLSNLRFCTIQENGRNANKTKRNTSGHKNISALFTNGKYHYWRVRIEGLPGKSFPYTDEGLEQAKKHRDALINEHHKEFGFNGEDEEFS